MEKLSVKKILYFILGLQIVLSIITVAVDIEYRWLRYFDRTEVKTGPVEPGDQIRLYEPRRISPDIFPEDVKREVPLPEKMPPRLTFKVEKLPKIGEFILINGGIETGDFARLRGYFEANPNLPKLAAFNSPGGSVHEALAIGRLLRSEKIDTLMMPGMYCFSACPYMFASGVSRIAYNSSAVGMHRHYFNKSIILPAFLAVEDIQNGQGLTMEYLIEMGIDPSIMIYSLKTPRDEIYVLVGKELLDTQLATKFID